MSKVRPRNSVPTIQLDKELLQVVTIQGELQREYILKGEELMRALSTFGCCILRNHGIQTTKILSAIDRAENFFKLPHQTKMKYKRQQNAIHGFIERGLVRANPERCEDLTESLVLQPGKMESKDWPERDIPGLKMAMTDLMSDCKSLCFGLARLITSTLKTMDDSLILLDHVAAKNQSGFCINYYPPVLSDVKESQMRLGEHADDGIFTLLLAKQLQGLQILARSGEWMNVTSYPGDVFIFAGELLKIHRVVIPEGIARSESRISLAYVFVPDDDKVVSNFDDNGKLLQVSSVKNFLESRFKTRRVKEQID